MSVKMYLSWRTKQRKFSPLGAKHHFLLLFCPPVRLHLHKREMGLYSRGNFKIGHLYSRGSPQRTNFERTLRCWADVFEILKIDNKPVFFKNYREAGITYTHDLLFDRDINVAFTHLSKKINKTNFLQWASLRHSIPSQLRFANVPLSTLSPSFTFENNTFDIREKRSKYYYSLHVSRKAQHPNITIKLQRDFDFTIDQINQIFLLPHSVALESYVKAFQYKVINSIFLYTNTKLCGKIGYRSNDLCTFCNTESETSNHFFYKCSHTRQFWTDFASYWHLLSKHQIHLSLKDVLFEILSEKCPLLDLLNYFIIIGKLFLWDCRRSQTLPKIEGFKVKIKIKYEIESKITKKRIF